MLLDVSKWPKMPQQDLNAWVRIIRAATCQHEHYDESLPKIRGNQYLDTGDESISQFVESGMLIYRKKVFGAKGRPYDLFKIRDAKMVRVNNHPDYPKFIKGFNAITQKRSRGDKQSKAKFAEAVNKYGIENIFLACKRATGSEYHRTNNLEYLTPEYILRDKILDRYLSMPATKTQNTAQFSGN